MNLCINCAHARPAPDFTADNLRCGHPSATIFSRFLVTGRTADLFFQFCSLMRGPTGPCGPAGLLFSLAPSPELDPATISDPSTTEE
jgi:hypothetical protein